jgi:hypothetical protein
MVEQAYLQPVSVTHSNGNARHMKIEKSLMVQAEVGPPVVLGISEG